NSYILSIAYLHVSPLLESYDHKDTHN
ncbi:hypothetical protein HKBW3S33_02185, partial [Candidatus Hakubella thermalkaliphila]